MGASRAVAAGAERPAREALIWVRWVLANLVGEAVGFGLGLTVAFVLAIPFGQPEGLLLVIAFAVEVIVIGGIEGLSVGLAQHWAVGRLLPGLGRREWVAATVPGAVIAWGTGLAIGNWAGDQFSAMLGDSWLIGGLVIGILAGAILSAFQWLPLHQVARRAWVWVPAHAGAWAIGMLVAFAGIGSIPEGAGPLTIVPTSVAIGVGMGPVVAALTGLALLWLLRGGSRGSQSEPSRGG